MNNKEKVAPYILEKLVQTRKVCDDCLAIVKNNPDLADEDPFEYVGEMEECADDAREAVTTIYNLLLEMLEDQEEA